MHSYLRHWDGPNRWTPANNHPGLQALLVGEASGEDAVATMSRVLAEIERLGELRERGVLTTKEFMAQKAKLLEGQR